MVLSITNVYIECLRRDSGPQAAGVKDSGLGIKEGVIEAIKFMANVKTFSLPW